LHSGLQKLRTVLPIFQTLPVPLVGGIVGTFLAGGVISLGSLIGFVTVLAVSARNGIMLMDHYRQLQRGESVRFGTEFVFRGAEERLGLILMTGLPTGLALQNSVVTDRSTPSGRCDFGATAIRPTWRFARPTLRAKPWYVSHVAANKIPRFGGRWNSGSVDGTVATAASLVGWPEWPARRRSICWRAGVQAAVIGRKCHGNIANAAHRRGIVTSL